MTIYVKTDIHVIVRNKTVRLKDFCEISMADQGEKERLKQLIFHIFCADRKQRIACSVLDIVNLIHKSNPELTISNEGEAEFILEYVPVHKSHPVWEIIKTGFVSLAIFFGSAFSIMTFNEDVSADEVLFLFYELVYHGQSGSLLLLKVSYCIGLPLGILIFFNHFSSRKKITDPTPLQMQIHLYEENESKAAIEQLKKTKKEGK